MNATIEDTRNLLDYASAHLDHAGEGLMNDGEIDISKAQAAALIAIGDTLLWFREREESRSKLSEGAKFALTGHR